MQEYSSFGLWNQNLMTCHSIIRRSFSKESTYNDKKHLTLQKEAEQKSKTPACRF